MTRFGVILFRLVTPVFLSSAFLLAASAGAQEMRNLAVSGYITAVHLPTGFDVNGEHVALQPDTGFGMEKDKKTENGGPLRSSIQVGAYVWVLGSVNNRTKTATAQTVLFRDDLNKELDGVAVIDKVLNSEGDRLFRADGYLIRLTPKTVMYFAGDVKTLADVGSNEWVHYRGKRDKAGVLVATRVDFLPARPAKIKAIPVLEEVNWQVKPANADSSQGSAATPDKSLDEGAPLAQDEKIKMGPLTRWHTIPADKALQERVQRVGNSVVPEYQKQLPDDNPSKMHIRFYAVDDAKSRSEICSFEGLVLVPSQLVERLKNDDQLAAVLADGVAFNLQRQAARAIVLNRALLGADIAADVAGVLVPGLGLAGLIGAEAGTKAVISMEEQRGRVALALMADAGYDLREAPEAWRLMAPRHLPNDLNSLKYPTLSGYQLSILSLQYNAKVAGETTPRANPPASDK